LVASARDHGVALMGPTLKHNQWPAQTEGAFTVQDVTLDADRHRATCPAGHTRQSGTADHTQGGTVRRLRFSTTDCTPCALHPRAPAPAHTAPP
jgi:transposase